MTTPPRWDLTNVYPSLESKEYQAAVREYKSQVAALGRFFDKKLAKAGPKTPVTKLAPLTGELIDRINSIQLLSGTIVPYLYAYVTTDSHDQVAKRAMSEFEQAGLPMDKLMVRMRSWLGSLGPKLNQVIKKNKTAAAHAFMLQENVRLSRYQMSNELEGLASELTLSGGTAWEKLQGTVTSQMTVDFELDGKMQKLPMPALINLRSHPDENTRRRGYEAENVAWESVKETLAACLNGIKGEVNTLNKRRGRKDAVHSASANSNTEPSVSTASTMPESR